MLGKMSNTENKKLTNCFLLVILVYISFTISSSFSDNTDEISTLQLLAIVHRHGFRTPKLTWTNDPYRNQTKYWPLGWGQLTPKGGRQLFRLGHTFRKRYADFITEYTAVSVRVNSSDLDRCHMSAAALLAGWFPPKKNQIWDENLLWQPIPIHSLPISMDRVLALRAPCPRYKKESNVIIQQIQANLTRMDKKLMNYLSKHMGENITSVCTINSYYSTMMIEEQSGYKLQSWTKRVYPHFMKQMANLCEQSHVWTPHLQKLYGGPVIKDVLQHFKNRIEGDENDKKLLLYSAHDTTIMPIMRALQFTEPLLPDYGASLIFELHKTENNFFVKLLYMNNTKVTKPHELSIPNCPNPCSFLTLYKITEYIRSVDWDNDCVI